MLNITEIQRNKIKNNISMYNLYGNEIKWDMIMDILIKKILIF